MAQTVSTKFSNAQASPANLPVAKIQLVLGNYCSSAAYGTTVTASNSDASGNYPASGVIDGDRTEINAGAASAADNGIGKSTWRSSLLTSSGPSTLTITFTKSRTINRIKLYQGFITGHEIVSYKVAYYNGTTDVVFAATPDLAIPNTVAINPVVGKVDQIDFPDVNTTRLTFTFYSVVGGDVVNVVEIEAYRVLDITSRVKGVKVSRQRDYKIANPMAAVVQLDCINTDRFFSISHVPTAAEAASGFVNAELTPNVQIVVQFGFNLYGPSPELVPAIVAYLDSITPNPRSRECKISGRDGMKSLINQVDSSNLKTNIEISQAIQYVLNRGNVSNYEMRLGNTNITIPYFFTDQEDHLTTIRDLTQAAGDSLFYFDESGIATFRFYTGNLPLSFDYPVQADWNTGTFAGNMEQNGSDELDLVVQHTVDKPSNNSGFVSQGLEATPNLQPGALAQSFQLPYDTILSNVKFDVTYVSSSGTAGTFHVWDDNGGQPGTSLYSTSISMPAGVSGTPLHVNVSPNLSLAGGIYWYGIQVGGANDGSIGFNDGNVNLSAPVQTAPTLPAPYPSTLAIGNNRTAWVQLIGGVVNGSPIVIVNLGTYTFKEATGSGSWTGAVLDLGAGVTAYNPIQLTYVLNGNTLNVLTQSSPDGITWSGFFPATGLQPQSPVNRYFQVQVTMTQSVLSGISARVLNLQVNWVGGVGTPKYPPAPASFTFDYNSNLINVEQELADNLGGDTSIINDVAVQAAPLLLSGSDSDTAWQGTVGTPPVPISNSVPLSVTAGDVLTLAPYVSGGMDISHMSGLNPSSVAITASSPSVVSQYKFTTIHPTLPVLQITIGVSGTISDLRLIGKTFSSQSTQQVAHSKDSPSIQQFGDRKQSLQNRWIITSQVAQVIANNIISVFKNPFSYIPSFTVQPTFSMQIGDRVTVHDVNLDVNSDYITVGIDHDFKISGDKPAIATTGKLLAVPSGQ